MLEKTLRVVLLFLFFFHPLSVITIAQEQKLASLGDFKLASGERIRDCRIGYRTFGKLNDQKSNAIAIPTWASGTTEQLKSNIGPGRLVNNGKYFRK